MERAAIYHRPDSEFAYTVADNIIQLRVRSKINDVNNVRLIYGDPYDFVDGEWRYQEEVVPKKYSTELFDYWIINVKLVNRRIQYAFVMKDENDEILVGDREIVDFDKTILKDFQYFKMPYLHLNEIVNEPAWIKNTVWYQIFPERFANGDISNDPKNVKEWDSNYSPSRNDFFGGDLKGVIDHLNYLEELGITGLYFCPIFSSPSNHKYDTTDYFKVDEHFGNDAVLRELIEEAHKRGMKVMLDAVFNHIGTNSVQWQDVVKHGMQSQYFDWFHIYDAQRISGNESEALFKPQKPVAYDTFAYARYMPKLNTENEDVQKYLLKIARYWIKKFDIDGWRLDVANEIDHHFWKEFASVCRSEKEDFYILGEVWNSAQPWLNGDEFSGSMNYPYTDIVKETVKNNQYTVKQMVAALNGQLAQYKEPINNMMLNVLDSHDTSRLLHQFDENKTVAKFVIAFTFLQRAMPCIYYGDEIGMTGGDDPDNRRAMNWDKSQQDMEMFYFYQEIIKIRKQFNNQANDFKNIVKNENLVQIWSNNKVIAIFNFGNADECLKCTQKSVMSQNFDGDRLKANGFVILEEE